MERFELQFNLERYVPGFGMSVSANLVRAVLSQIEVHVDWVHSSINRIRIEEKINSESPFYSGGYLQYDIVYYIFNLLR